MNKAPQPPSGPPLPAASPGLPQPSYPGPFSTPPPQMNPAAQPRQFASGPRALPQQPYYPSRTALPASSGRVQQSSAPRPIPPPHGTRPAHVFQPGPSQMMMIPQQQISFPNSQGTAYYIPGQYRPSYVTPQQYQVTGSPGFYTGTSPADYGAYYPAQPQFTPPVAPTPVIIPAPPQQQAPPPQQQQAPPRRERKPIRIRDPNQGGRDITEEIMSGGRSGLTPTPPQPNGDNATSPVVMTTRAEFPIPPGESPFPDTPQTPPPTSPISDTVDAPPLAPADDSHVTPAVVDPPPFNIAEVTPVKSKEEGSVTLPMPVPAPQAEPVLESPIVQPEELQLFNGVPARDISPIAEPDMTKEAPPITMEIPDRTVPLQVVKETPVVGVKEVPAPVVKVPASVVMEPTPPFFKEPIPPFVKEHIPPVVKESITPVVKEHIPPVVKESIPPVVKESIPPVVKEHIPPVVKEHIPPVVKEHIPLVVKESIPPVVKEHISPVVKEPIPPVVKEIPVPVKETVAPVCKETTAPVLKETPALGVKATVPVVAKEAPTAVVSEALTQEAVVKEIPTKQVLETPLVVKETPSLVAKETPEPLLREATAPSEVVASVSKATPPPAEEREDTPTAQTTPPESTLQVVSMPKKRRKMKDLNKKEAGDLLDAFKEPTPPEPEVAPVVEAEPENTPPVAPPPPEDLDETWEEKEDKLDAENIKPQSPTPTSPTEQKYQYKAEQWKPLNLEEKKKYDREFLLGFQFISASMSKPEGLPQISDVVLDKANKTPLRQLDPSRLPGMNCGPDFTPSFANLGRPSAGGRGPPSGLSGPRRSGQGQRGKEPRKIIASVSLTEDVQLNKAEKAWKPSVKRSTQSRVDEDDPDFMNTQELFKRVRSVLNKLTPQMFQPLMKQVTELTIDTEERLKGVIDLIFEKAISEPNFSVAYANMCRCLMGLKVPTTDKPGVSVNFRKLLLNRCQKEFEKDKDDDETFEKKQKELDAATGDEVKQRLKEELEDAKDKARRRSLGNIKFIGELFKLKMLTETIMHDCIVKLLKNHDEESLECLCRLLSTIGKDLDFEKAKPRMDQYFHQMEKIIKERKTSSRIRFMLQDVIDLRRNNWVPRRGDLGPKTIEQIHKEAELEEHREQAKVQQQLMTKKDGRGGGGGDRGGGGDGRGGGGGGMGSRGGSHTPGSRGNQAPDDGWNTVPISTKNRPIDPTRLSKITKPGALDFNNQLLAPGGKGTWGSWGKGSSGGTGAKPSEGAQDSGRPSTLNRFSALQQPSSSSSSGSVDSDRRVPHRNSSSRERSDRFDRRDERMDRGGDRYDRRDDRGSDRLDRNRPAVGKRSFSREKERSREREQRPAEMVRRVSSMTDERERERDRGSRENVKRETVPTPPPVSSKPALTEEELEKKSTAIIEEYLHINDMTEALQCVIELDCASLLSVFVRTGIESTLERSALAREHLGLLFHQLVKTKTLSTQQYYKGLLEVLEVAEDMAIDIPHIWLYLAELICPILHEGGIPMGPLFREVSKPLVPLGKAGEFLVEILNLLCKGMSHKKVGAMWRDAGLSWKDLLPEDEDVNKFVTEKGVEFTLGEECDRKSSKSSLSPEDIIRELERLLQEKADNQRIFDWVEANLDEQQTASNMFVRAMMTAVCQSAIICENPYKVDAKEITQRAKLLQRYIKDEQKELQALYALQGLMVQMEQPPNLLRMFFDVLYDEDVIKEEGFYRWESSKDPAEQQGKGVALKSVTAFFTWLREAEDESDNS
ncbi:eukaryotic translation initiation factor 4 gamma 1 isoform X2 [Pimephales promelas]|uniref:eukaryotic translation initiation factor 4 gamma 1 isoform X2 n=1 Tax=Pimephales promelas TaxID=90988 RepID=UPI001955A58A|nr:eukaryotic translation initiation factor 4 gamma 1 isoform X2 [Pimephales promelas]KAG1932736.1 eukaryotic translation initiation factor 4 gamma [Pimephales promelas]KAG1932741.1 eukaryotic translation initiation factor 4 gamma [Pimephales promelas]